MSKETPISWTNRTWNPFQGCTKISAGCVHCYMFRDKKRYGQDPTKVVRSAPVTFNAPLKWKEPALVFTCSWSDWFHRDADVWRDEAYDIIRRTPHLTYQILTKRADRIKDHLPADWGDTGYPNVWLGVSTENQRRADERIPLLDEIPARVKFISAEPLLGPLDITRYLTAGGISWVITGGESGYRGQIRPAELDWFRAIRDQCQSAGVPFHHKQHGGWERIDGHWGGRELDGREWQEMPRVAAELVSR